ncbi:MAG: BatD family protein [Paludibacter sp.]|nr:BatD family protein [Paludibacter sp.]
MRYKILFLTLLIFTLWGVNAEEQVRFTASAPSTVIADKPFQLVYTVNASGSDFRAPEITNFEVLAGPFKSTSSSYQIINGKATSSVSNSYTYTLQASKQGTFTIPSATIMVDGTKYISNGLSIKVLPPEDPSAASSGSSSRRSTSSGQSINNENLFVRASISKSNIYENEAVTVTYKLYTLVDVVQCVNKKMPDFNGFMKQDLDQDQNKQFSYENFNGKNYGSVVLYQVVLYPQHSGEITIDKSTYEAVVRVQNRSQVRSIFDDFFDSYTNVNKNLVAPSLKIRVLPLPENKPAGFNGTVGHFSMKSNISANQVKENDAITIKVSISGSGNMKLIKNPDIKAPDGFDVYDPKVTNNFKASAAGVSGTKTIEYMFIPRHAGDYVIPEAEFSYFDSQDKKYKILKSPAYNLKVLKGDGSSDNTVVGTYVNKEDVKQLAKDIRFIETNPIAISSAESVPAFGTLLGWLLYGVPLVIALFLFFFLKKHTEENSNIEFVKNKKANKVARKRLNLAQKLLSEGKKDQFYEEVMKAVWNYLSDKLTIPASSLTKERVQEELSAKGVSPDAINELMQILNTCEFARFAPNTGQQEMGNLYAETIKAISNLENIVRK